MTDYIAPKNPRDCTHSQSWVPGMAQGDYTRLCEECGLELDSVHNVIGVGDAASVDAVTLKLIQRVQKLEGLVHLISLRLDGLGVDMDSVQLVREDISRVTGWTFSKPENY